MKFFSEQVSSFIQQRRTRRNFGYFFQYICILGAVILLFTVIFHVIMEYEGRSYSWITGLYWTLTVMSTLGFGDITFFSDAGRAFSLLVLLTGILALLIVLPTAFIQLVYTPWLDAQKAREVKHSLPASTAGHVIIVGDSPICRNLAQVLGRYGFYSVLLSGSTQQALELMDQGLHAVMGDYDDVEVYRSLRAENARMVVTLDDDARNMNSIFKLRELTGTVPVVSRAERDESIEILSLAGCTWVFQFRKALGRSLTRRVLTGKLALSTLTTLGPLVIAEVPVKQTSLTGLSLRQSGLRSRYGINVVGLWNRGIFEFPTPDTEFSEHMVLVIAGTREQMEGFSRALLLEPAAQAAGPVLVLGGGRVGMAAAQALHDRGVDVVIVDKRNIAPLVPGIRVQVGDASDLVTLKAAGIDTAPSIIITTHDDDINIYLTIYCRRIRPDVQIISRTNLDRNVRVLHTAGANLVLSLASLVANRIINLLDPGRVFMLNEGMNLFRAPAGKALAGRTLATSGIRTATHCNVVAVKTSAGETLVNPDPHREFESDDELFLVGGSEAEASYYEEFWPERAAAPASARIRPMPPRS
ncbi:NAD-binding protein [uncultured Mailhella sp.]|uniref:potassium channel family protein n=1 Tax=uncultured Mailhella sp. TaxID=1981031 RepID=UPI00262A2796|nr:NAD-binding protein [uncultured Mailhella sp.]